MPKSGMEYPYRANSSDSTIAVQRRTQERRSFYVSVRQKFVIFDPNSQVALQKRNEADQPERVDMKRFVRVANGGQRRAGLVQIIFQLLRYFHFIVLFQVQKPSQ